MDLTDVPMARGFVDLAAAVDWSSCRILSCRLFIIMEGSFYVEALEENLALHSKPEIFSADQRLQSTSRDFIDELSNAITTIGMDDKECWRSRIFVERLWRSIKYELDRI